MTETEFKLICLEDDRHKAVSTLVALDRDFNHDRRQLEDGRSYDLDTLSIDELKTLLLISYDQMQYVLDEVHKAAEKVTALERRVL